MSAMNVIVQLSPIGGGSENAESFHSLLLRTSSAHSVKMSKLLELIGGIRNSEAHYVARGKSLAASLLGTGKVVSQTVAAFEMLGGSPSSICHTLYDLFPVLSHRAIGLLEIKQRWCPECLHPDTGTGYGLLAHSLRGVQNCRLHGYRLESHCLSCYQATYYGVNLVAEPKCRSCGSRLWVRKRAPVSNDHFSSWVEAQMYSVVEYVSSIEKPQIDFCWMRQAEGVLKQLVVDSIGKTVGSGSRHIRLLRNNAQHGLTMATILWLAASHSTSVIDVMLRPNEALTGVFPGLPEIPRKVSHRCRRRANHWPKTRTLLLGLMELDDEFYLPSMATLCAVTGVNEAYVWNKDAELSRSYNRKRKLQNHRNKTACDREYVVRVAPLLFVVDANRYALQEVSARKPVQLPSLTLRAIEATVEITLSVIGRQISIPPSEFGMLIPKSESDVLA